MEFGLNMKSDEKMNSVSLKGVSITGETIGEILHVKIVQRYVNTENKNAEFIYTFPLPDKASVCGFNAKIGERAVKGQVKERDKAFKDYDDAVLNGDSAFLLENFRPNVFQVSLGQAGIGDEIVIEIIYIQEIKAVDGEIRITIPTLVAPRYMSGTSMNKRHGMGTSQPTDRVPDADFISPPIGDAPYRAEISLKVNAGRKITSVKSPTHNINASYINEDTAFITLSDGKTEMDRDFSAVIGVFGEQTSRCIFGKGQFDEYFAYTTIIPELPAVPKKKGTEYIFLIDVSGSMAGEKLNQAKNAMNICLRNLTGEDSFNMAAFESSLYTFSNDSLRFDQESLDAATAWIDVLTDMGGTEILPAVKFALKNRAGSGRVVMLFTDGQVGNESEIIKYVKQNSSNVRFYSMGIDTSVNSYFINQIADAGNGSSEFVYPGENIDDKVIRQFSRINSSYMERNRIEAGAQGVDAAGGMPSRLYDLEPSSLILKLDSRPSGSICVKGYTGRDEINIEIDEMVESENGDMLERMWARRKIEEMERYQDNGNPRRIEHIKTDIVKISEKYGVISSLTSFVAVYERENKLSGLPETVVIPVSEPNGWDMFESTSSRRMPHPRRKSLTIDNILGAVVNNSGKKNFVSYFMAEPKVDYMMSDVRNLFDSSLMSEKSAHHKAREKGSSDIKGNDDIKALASRQNYDGSFGKTSGDSVENIRETAKALITFASSANEISPFRGQLKKAIEYVISGEDKLMKDDSLMKIVYVSLELCRVRKIIRESGMKALMDFIDKLRLKLGQGSDIEELDKMIADNNIEGLKKYI